jgi:hypothetical protein
VTEFPLVIVPKGATVQLFGVNVAVFELDVEQVNAAGHDEVEYPVFGVQTGVTVAL